MQEEKRCRRDEVCAGAQLASTSSHEQNLKDVRDVLNSIAPALMEPGLRQLQDLAEAPEPPEGSRVAHPAVRLAGLLLLDAGRRGASDVLVVPGSWCSLVQYRLSGVLVPIVELSLPYHRALAARCKVLAGLDMGARMRVQDGQTRAEEDCPRAIIRVLPTVHGERLDIHLEGPPKSIQVPRELGFSDQDLGRYQRRLEAQAGLIIHAGLSGTGKRTALLAALAHVSQQNRSAFALLSRPAQDIAGVSVTIAGQDRAALFRGILERKPDAIAVDDLSGQEIMREALAAAAGGILVLGSLPGDGAVAALRGLFDMGLAPDLLRRGLSAICAHRLPRRLCSCRKLAAPRPEELEALGVRAEASVGRPIGCPACLHTGFRGVTPLFELLVAGENLKPLLKADVPDKEWLKAAQADGMTPFRESLTKLVVEGATSYGEARRVGLGV